MSLAVRYNFSGTHEVTQPSISRWCDKRCFCIKALDFVLSLLRELRYAICVFYHRRITLAHPQQPINPGDPIVRKVNSKGLFVLLHGLRNSPSAWYSQLRLLEGQNCDVFAPLIRDRGLCSLEDAAWPILAAIGEYIFHNPNKPICFLGTSNGGRLTTWLEYQLRIRNPETRVRVSNIAGAHFGSSRMNLLSRWGLAHCFYPPELVDELEYGSAKAQELMRQANTPLPDGCERSYEFFATREDLSIPDLDSTLPSFGKNADIHLLSGWGHSSIVAAVAEQQIRSSLAWMEKQA